MTGDVDGDEETPDTGDVSEQNDAWQEESSAEDSQEDPVAEADSDDLDGIDEEIEEETPPPEGNWIKTYDERPYPPVNRSRFNSIQAAHDGGYIASGSIGDPALSIETGIRIVKLGIDGDVLWEKYYLSERVEDVSEHESSSDIRQTLDGGYVTVGMSNPDGYAETDLVILKIDESGGIEWQRGYGGPLWEEGISIRQMPDESYIVAGEATSFGMGDNDVWVLRLDRQGEVLWEMTCGGPSDEIDARAVPTSDGGFIVSAATRSFGAGDLDMLVMKLDEAGGIQWQLVMGEEFEDRPRDVIQASDGGYLLVGEADIRSTGSTWNDGWAVKLGPDGEIEWQKIYGGTEMSETGGWTETFFSVENAIGGGYVIGGTANSIQSFYDYCGWILKLDTFGEIVWQTAYGAESEDIWLRAVAPSSAGGYIAAGYMEIMSGGVLTHSMAIKVGDDGEVSDGCPLDRGMVPGGAFETAVVPIVPPITPIPSHADVYETTFYSVDTAYGVETWCSG